MRQLNTDLRRSSNGPSVLRDASADYAGRRIAVRHWIIGGDRNAFPARSLLPPGGKKANHPEFGSATMTTSNMELVQCLERPLLVE